MNRDLKTLVETLAVFGAAVFFLACPFKSKEQYFRGSYRVKDETRTAQGVRVQGVNKVQAAALPMIDRGLARAFAIAEAPPNNYRVRFRHSTYTVVTYPRSSVCTEPGIATDMYQKDWDQTDFDKDRRPGHTLICFAGVMFRTGAGDGSLGTPGMLIVDDLRTTETIVWYEAEHNILLEEDQPRYVATAGVHDHPIMGHGAETKLAASEDLPKWKAISFRLSEEARFGDAVLPTGTDICLLPTK